MGETPTLPVAAQRYFVCFAPYHFDAQGRTLPHMPLIIINLYNNEYNINILFMYIYYYIMCAYYVANVATFEIVLLMQCRKREIKEKFKRNLRDMRPTGTARTE